MKRIHLIIVSVLAILLQACANPIYKNVANEKTAHLKVLYNTTVSICTQGAVFDLRKNPKQDFYVIPANKRFDLTSTASYSGYQITYYCSPKISFKPEEGKTYLLDLSVTGDRCILDLAQEDKASKTGLAPDLTVGPPVCFAN